MMTLWTISRSTLFVGGDPTAMTDAQASLFLNDEVLAVSNGSTNPRQLACLPHADCTCNLTHPPAHASAVWAADAVTTAGPAAAQRSFVALFNLGAGASIPSVLGGMRSEVSVRLDQIRPAWGRPRVRCSLRDLWQHRSLGQVRGDSIAVSLARHDAALLVLMRILGAKCADDGHVADGGRVAPCQA